MADPSFANVLNGLASSFLNVANNAKYAALDAAGTKQIADAYFALATKIKNASNNTDDWLLTAGSLLTTNKGLIAQYDELNKQIAFLEDRNKELNKTFGIGSVAAAKLSTTYQKLANAAKSFSGEQAIVYGNNIRKMLPMYKQQGKENDTQFKNLMAIQHVLTTNMGLTEEEAANYTMYASKAGENAASLMQVAKRAAELAGDSDGSLGYMKMITEGIAAAGADIQLQYGRLGGNLEIAVLKANKLGFELEDLAQTGDQLLNIESSIGDELEYQLLSGRRLVDQQSGKSLTNMYRQATLMGDMSKQADALNTILEQEGDTLENNLFARKQMAQLLNMDEATLARSLQKKKLLEKEGLTTLMNLDGSQLQSAAEAMMKNGEINETTYKEIAKIADTRTSDEIAKAQYELQAEMVSDMKDLLSETQDSYVQLSRQTMLASNMNGILASGFNITRADAIRGSQILGLPTDESAALDARYGTQVKDVVIPPGGSAPIISAPAGTFILDPQDTIMAGTQLLPNGGASTTSGGNDQLASIMLQVGRMIVAAINSKGSNVFGATTMNSGYYDIGAA